MDVKSKIRDRIGVFSELKDYFRHGQQVQGLYTHFTQVRKSQESGGELNARGEEACAPI